MERASLVFFPLFFVPQYRSNEKICLLSTIQSPAARPASAVARCPRRMRAVSSAPGTARIKAVLQQLPRLFHLWFVCFQRRVQTFSLASRRLSRSHTLTHPPLPVSRPPLCSLGKGNWTEQFTFTKAAFATYFTSSLALAGPGSPMWTSCWGNSRQDGGKALSSAILLP